MLNARSMKSAIILALALLSAQFAVPAHSQILSRGDLFGPGAPPPMLGAELGFGSHKQMGVFMAACSCEFESGSGSGMLLNALFELPLDYDWVIGIKTGVDFKSTKSVTPKEEASVIRFPAAQDSLTTGTIRFNREGNVSATYLQIAPFVKYQFFRMGPFVQAGAGIGIMLGSNFTHHRVLTSSSATLSDGSQLRNIRFENGTDEETLEDGKIADALGTRISALLTAGYDIQVSERSVIAPMLTYEMPFSTIRENGNLANDWKISSLFFTVALKFKLG
jgi:hypothetical protein